MIVGGLVVETNPTEILEAIDAQTRIERQQSDVISQRPWTTAPRTARYCRSRRTDHLRFGGPHRMAQVGQAAAAAQQRLDALAGTLRSAARPP